jgi:hypothetical protein
MSYSLGSAGSRIEEIALLAEARKKYEEDYAKTHNGVKPPPEIVEKYMKEHPEVYQPGVLEKASSLLKFGIIGVVVVLFGPVVLKLLKKKEK